LIFGSSAALVASAALLSLDAAFSLVGFELGLLSFFLLLCLEPDAAFALMLADLGSSPPLCCCTLARLDGRTRTSSVFPGVCRKGSCVSQHSQMKKGNCVVLTPGGPVGLRIVRPEPRKMSKSETGNSVDFEPAIVAPRQRCGARECEVSVRRRSVGRFEV
jgi:hypothetical protein